MQCSVLCTDIMYALILLHVRGYEFIQDIAFPISSSLGLAGRGWRGNPQEEPHPLCNELPCLDSRPYTCVCHGYKHQSCTPWPPVIRYNECLTIRQRSVLKSHLSPEFFRTLNDSIDGVSTLISDLPTYFPPPSQGCNHQWPFLGECQGSSSGQQE